MAGMESVLAGLGLGLGSGLAPGPLFVLALAVTLRHGRGPGLQVAIAPLLSDLIIIGIALTVVSQMPAMVITWLGIAGGLVIGYFAWETWRASRESAPDLLIDAARKQSEPGKRPAWVQGFLVNLLNPAPWIFWTTAGSALLLEQAQRSSLAAVSFLVAFYLGLVGSKVVMVLALSAGRHRISGKVYRYLLIGASIALAVIGLGFLVRNITMLLA